MIVVSDTTPLISLMKVGRLELVNQLRKGHTPEQISDFNDISLEEVLAVQMAMIEEDKNEMVCNIT